MRWSTFALRAIGCHVTTYLIAGGLAMQLFDYASLWPTMPWMRPLDSPWVAAGPALQVVRGLILGVVLWPFRERFLQPGGWLPLWGLLAGIGILSTYGAAPGSVEAAIYTTAPLVSRASLGLIEVFGQSLAFSVALVGWCRHPSRIWSWSFGIGTALAVASSALGLAFG